VEVRVDRFVAFFGAFLVLSGLFIGPGNFYDEQIHEYPSDVDFFNVSDDAIYVNGTELDHVEWFGVTDNQIIVKTKSPTVPGIFSITFLWFGFVCVLVGLVLPSNLKIGRRK